jgi:hypothetical protein
MSIRRSLPRVALTLLLAAMATWAIFHRKQQGGKLCRENNLCAVEQPLWFWALLSS